MVSEIDLDCLFTVAREMCRLDSLCFFLMIFAYKRHDWVEHEQLNFLVDLLECWHCKQWFGLSIINLYSPSKFNTVCSSTGGVNWCFFQWDPPLHVRFEKRHCRKRWSCFKNQICRCIRQLFKVECGSFGDDRNDVGNKRTE